MKQQNYVKHWLRDINCKLAMKVNIFKIIWNNAVKSFVSFYKILIKIFFINRKVIWKFSNGYCSFVLCNDFVSLSPIFKMSSKNTTKIWTISYFENHNNTESYYMMVLKYKVTTKCFVNYTQSQYIVSAIIRKRWFLQCISVPMLVMGTVHH